MEKVAGNGRSAGSNKKQHRLVACAALALCGAACQPGWAQQAAQVTDTVAAQARIEQPRVQVQASTLPRFDAQDAGTQASRVDLTLYPSNRYGVGAMVGMSGFAQGSTPPAATALQARPSVDVGVRFSQRVQSQQVDIMAWRRMNTEDDAYSLTQQRQPVYGARVEMNLSAGRKTGLGIDHGHVGVQLESGARISIKRSNGRPMIYYRNTF